MTGPGRRRAGRGGPLAPARHRRTAGGGSGYRPNIVSGGNEIHRQRTPRNIREVEAEGVAFILFALLGLSGLDESAATLQSWLGEGAISERSAQRIYAVANKILAAGQAGPHERPPWGIDRTRHHGVILDVPAEAAVPLVVVSYIGKALAK